MAYPHLDNNIIHIQYYVVLSSYCTLWHNYINSAKSEQNLNCKTCIGKQEIRIEVENKDDENNIRRYADRIGDSISLYQDEHFSMELYLGLSQEIQ